jgi:hypothetical protein
MRIQDLIRPKPRVSKFWPFVAPLAGNGRLKVARPVGQPVVCVEDLVEKQNKTTVNLKTEIYSA